MNAKLWRESAVTSKFDVNELENPYSPPVPSSALEPDRESIVVRLVHDSTIEREICMRTFSNDSFSRTGLFWRNLFLFLMWWSPFITAIFAIQMITFSAAWYPLHIFSSELLLVGILIPIFLPFALRLFRRQRTITLPTFLDYSVELRFSNDGVHVKAARQELWLRWESFDQCFRSHQGFLLLWGNNRCSMILNTSIEGEGSIERLAQLLKQHIEKYKETSSERP